MTNLRKAVDMACQGWEDDCAITEMDGLMKALRQALAQSEQESVCAHGVEKTKCDFCKQPEQEPVAYYYESSPGKRGVSLHRETEEWQPLYTAPPKKEWVGLTDEEIGYELTKEFGQWWSRHVSVCRAIEAKLKEKNNG